MAPAAARVFQALAYTVVLIFVVLFAVGAVKAGYGVFRVVAPDTSAMISISETAEREGGIADIVSGLALAGASWWVFQMPGSSPRPGAAIGTEPRGAPDPRAASLPSPQSLAAA